MKIWKWVVCCISIVFFTGIGELLKDIDRIFIILIISFPIAIIFLVVRDYLQTKNKNESPEDKKKREELEKIKEWSRHNKC